MAAAAHILGVLEDEAEAGACLAADRYSAVVEEKSIKVRLIISFSLHSSENLCQIMV